MGNECEIDKDCKKCKKDNFVNDLEKILTRIVEQNDQISELLPFVVEKLLNGEYDSSSIAGQNVLQEYADHSQRTMYFLNNLKEILTEKEEE